MDVINKPIFFLNGKVLVKNGKLVWRQLFQKKHVTLNNIVGIIPHKGIFNPRLTFILKGGSSHGRYFADVMKLPAKEISKVVTLIKENVPNAKIFSPGAKIFTDKKTYSNIDLIGGTHSLLPKSTVWVNDEGMYFHDKRYEIRYFKAEEYPLVEYFNISNDGINVGHREYQIHWNGPQTVAEQVKKHLIDNGAEKLSKLKEGKSFVPKRSMWGILFGRKPKETLTVGADYIGYEIKKGKKSDSIYLPIDDIYINLSQKTLLSCKIDIRGIQNIIPTGKFSKKTLEELRRIIKIPAADIVAKSYFKLFGIFPLWSRKNAGTIGIQKEKGRIIIELSEEEQKRREKTKNLESMKVGVFPIEDVDWYACKKRGSFFSRSYDVFIVFLATNMRWGEDNRDQHGIWKGFRFKRLSDFNQIKDYLTSKGKEKSSWKKTLGHKWK